MAKRSFRITFPIFLILVLASLFVEAAPPKTQNLTALEDAVRHELVMLPYYTVFDHLEFKVNGSEVVLLGQVTRPTLKSAAESVVSRLKEVTAVHSQIEVLPLSSEDNRIRLALYRTIYGHPSLFRYSLQPVPPIRIMVNSGHVTLEGFAFTEADKNIAYILANSVFGVFDVKNRIIA